MASMFPSPDTFVDEILRHRAAQLLSTEHAVRRDEHWQLPDLLRDCCKVFHRDELRGGGVDHEGFGVGGVGLRYQGTSSVVRLGMEF